MGAGRPADSAANWGPRGSRHTHADRDILLCGGSVNSPQLLLLSGIGDPDELHEVGIDAPPPLPGVGRNLQDHLMAPVVWETRNSTDIVQDLLTPENLQRWRVGERPDRCRPPAVGPALLSYHLGRQYGPPEQHP
nr:GMC family oxidoreductase N-terminal domain-containing protein [Streptomyces broussonetiae]